LEKRVHRALRALKVSKVSRVTWEKLDLKVRLDPQVLLATLAPQGQREIRVPQDLKGILAPLARRVRLGLREKLDLKEQTVSLVVPYLPTTT